MNKIIVLLCLGLVGCSTIPRDNKTSCMPAKESTANAGSVIIDPKEINSIIDIFSEAIKNNPNYAGAYYNRAAAYFYKNDYDKSWQDIHKAEELGINVDLRFTELVGKLKKASGRDK
jgi:tetratricopeptide (TPR) repeat protein